jgi:iron complex outermembrane receptor protein
LYTRWFSRLNTGFFAEHFISGKRITVQSGVMVYHNSTLEGTGAYPGIDVSYRFLKNLSVYGAFNKTLRMPTFTDMFYKSPVQQGNRALLPEKAVTVEGGIKYNGPEVTAHLAAFLRKGTDLIDWVKDPSPDSLIWRSMNHAGINLRGTECSLKWIPSRDGSRQKIVEAGISYAFLSGNAEKDQLLSKYVLDYLRHQLSGSLDFRIYGKFFGTARVTWRDRNGTYPDATGKTTEYHPYWLSDIRIYRKTDHLMFFTDISNILNTKYMDYGGIVQPGRWITAGLVIDVDYLKK